MCELVYGGVTFGCLKAKALGEGEWRVKSKEEEKKRRKEKKKEEMQNKYATLREKNLKMRKCRQLWWLARRASDWQKYLGKSSHVHTPPRPCLLALGRWMNCCWRGEIYLLHIKCLATHLAISRFLFVRKWFNDESPLSLGPFQGPLLHLFPSFSSSPSFFPSSPTCSQEKSKGRRFESRRFWPTEFPCAFLFCVARVG